MTFDAFLRLLADELDLLAREQTADSRPQHFVVRSFADAASSDCVMSIGLGTQAGDDAVPLAGAFPVALNNKAPWGGHWDGKSLSSVVHFVLGAPAAVIAQWNARLGKTSTGARRLTDLSLCVEDASPDSCFGFITGLALMSGVPRADVPEEWVRYIDAWERGATSHSAALATYGELHNALVHAMVVEDIRGAWISGLQLMVACLARRMGPTAIDLDVGDPAIRPASANLRYEKATYDAVLPALQKLQLRLPLSATPGRSMIVDAILVEERVLMGAHKSYLRADRTNSFLGRGFTLNAIFRTEAEGNGNDMTISLDEAAGLTLRDLWLALEAEEDLRWAGDRPNDKPRQRIGGYPSGKRVAANGAPSREKSPNQPWYHETDFTLIAAPRRLADGALGSQLSWNDVLEIVWSLYNPFAESRIVPTVAVGRVTRPILDTELRRLEDCPSEALSGVSRRRSLKVGRWHRPDNSVLPLQWSPTFGRVLAACLEHEVEPGTALSLRMVLDAPDHDHLQFDNGMAVISRRGCYVLSSDIGDGLDSTEFRTVFERCAGAMDWIENNTDAVTEITGTVHRYLSGEKTSAYRQPMAIYNRISELQLGISALRHRLDAATVDRRAQQFRDAILTNWGITGRLDALYRDLDEAKGTLVSHGELVTDRRIAFLTYFGFPLALAAGLFSFVFSSIPPTLSWPPDLTGLNWQGLIGALLFTLAGVGVMYFMSRHDDRKATITSRK